MITIKKEQPETSPFWRSETFLLKIIHEMLHAVFDLYTCQCEKGCRQKLEEAEKAGDRGDHDPWQKAAECIENQSREIYGANWLNLRRHEAMASEVFHGRELPGEDILYPVLGLRKAKILEAVKSMIEAAAQAGSIKPIARQKGNVCIVQNNIIL